MVVPRAGQGQPVDVWRLSDESNPRLGRHAIHIDARILHPYQGIGPSEARGQMGGWRFGCRQTFVSACVLTSAVPFQSRPHHTTTLLLSPPPPKLPVPCRSTFPPSLPSFYAALIGHPLVGDLALCFKSLTCRHHRRALRIPLWEDPPSRNKWDPTDAAHISGVPLPFQWNLFG